MDLNAAVRADSLTLAEFQSMDTETMLYFVQLKRATDLEDKLREKMEKVAKNIDNHGADSTKINKSSFTRLGSLEMIHSFITDSTEVLKLQAFANKLHTFGLVVQALAIALVIGRWKALVRWASVRGIVQPFEVDRALAFRGKAATFLLLYLILIPIGPSRIWSLFTGTAG